MLITESTLRRIIKEELVKEGLLDAFAARFRSKPTTERPNEGDLALYRMDSGVGITYLIYNPQALLATFSKMENPEEEITANPDPALLDRLTMKDGGFVGYIIIRSAKQVTGKPCIPQTYDVGFVGTWPMYRKKGFGELLYKLAAADMSKKKDAGLTSDRETQTSMGAGKSWRKLKLSMVPRKTKAGNDRFDYDKSTPDPDDDCKLPGSPENSIHQSLEINPSEKGEYELIYKQMIANHKEFAAVVKSQFGAERNIVDRFIRSGRDAGRIAQ
tara:strand:+ start:73 stop:888 length:816 start_codon:yes stop_codon:yes gene_type:complete